MSELISVKGRCKPLFGKIEINGSKNAVLPIMAASLLSSSPVTLTNVPDLTDVRNMSKLLENFGAKLIFYCNKNDEKSNHRLEIDCSNLNNDETIISEDVTNKLRASILTLGPIIGRLNKIHTAIPGGCKIGERPIDMHIKALEKMGVSIEKKGCLISGIVDKNLRGVDIIFEKRSIGATENVIMAATLADGVTTIENAAIEPEVNDLISFLNKMGAKIDVDDSCRIKITGVKSLTGSSHRIIPDRMEAGTYALAAVITNGKLELEGISLSDIGCMAKELEAIGACLDSRGESIIVSRKNGPIKPIIVATNSYPNFPSDMQPQLMSALCIANGVSIVKENVFEDRLNHVYELIKLGADISVIKNSQAIIRGPKILSGTHLTATDLRSTAALILASLAADGETVIYHSHYLSRGYEAMPEKLCLCGADISVFKSPVVPENM